MVVQQGGSNSSGLLTFFVDGGALPSAYYMAPWSNVTGPADVMGTFGGSNVNGTWTLSVTDGAAGDVGILLGWGIRLNGTLTGIQPISNIVPIKFQLYQNYPNPFNPSTNIKFDIPKDGIVKVAIYDILGREVSSLLNEFKKAGQYEVQLNAANFASGTYFYKIEAGNFVETKKMILVK